MEATQAELPGRPLATQIAAFTLVRPVVTTMFRMVYPFLAVFGRGMGVGLTEMSWALSIRSLAGTFGPLLASIGDSRGRKTSLLLGLFLFTLGASLVFFWPFYGVFVLALALTCIGYFVFVPSVHAYLGDRIPYQRRALAIALTEIGWSLSFILGVPLMGLLISRYGWSSPFPVLAILGALAFAGLAVVLPSEKVTPEGRPGIWRSFRTVFSTPSALASLAMGVMISAANESVNLVFGVWLEDAFQFKIAALGAVAIGIGLAELGGETLVGALVDRGGKVRSVTVGLLSNSLAALALILAGRSLVGAIASLLFFYITFEFTIVSTIPLMTEVLPSARATLLATNIALFSLGRALAASMASFLYGQQVIPGLPAIGLNALATLCFNLLALLALRTLYRMIGHRI